MKSPEYEEILSDVKKQFEEKEKQIEYEIYDLEKKKILLSIAKHNNDIYMFNETELDIIDYYSVIGVTKEEVNQYDVELQKNYNRISELHKIYNILDNVCKNLQ